MNDNPPATTRAKIAHAIVAAMDEFDGNASLALAKVRNQHCHASPAEFDAARQDAIAILTAQANAQEAEADKLEGGAS